jgi:hypothetical protein
LKTLAADLRSHGISDAAVRIDAWE